eukprot:jgi/Psemu1/48574/gm1.48574_g
MTITDSTIDYLSTTLFSPCNNNDEQRQRIFVASPPRHFNGSPYRIEHDSPLYCGHIDTILVFYLPILSFRDDAFIHQSNMSDSNLRLLFPSFDLKLARILHTTLDVPQEACNHLCEALILANLTTWDWFITTIIDYGYVADLEYHVQTGYRSISMDDQQTLTTFVDLTYLINSQAGRNWYDHHQYTRDVFLTFCDTRDRSPGMAAIQNKATAKIPLAPFPHVTAQVPLASQLSIQAKPCLTKPVLSQASSTTTTYVSKTAQAHVPVTPPARVSVTAPTPVSSPSQASNPACKTPAISTIANNENPLGSPETHKLARPITDPVPVSTSTPSYTWTYFPRTESVRFQRVVSSTIPFVTTVTTTGDAYSISNRKRHSPSPSHSKPSAISRWTFRPKSGTVTFQRSPKKFSSHKPSTCIPLLQLPPSGAFSKDSVVPSSGQAIVPSPSHAYPQHGASPCPGRKPLYGAHSLTYDSPAVCITKRHCDAIKLKLYHLHATLLFDLEEGYRNSNSSGEDDDLADISDDNNYILP